jgi:hypothetical protein
VNKVKEKWLKEENVGKIIEITTKKVVYFISH